MPHDGQTQPLLTGALLPDLITLTNAALPAAEAYLARALTALRGLVCRDSKPVPALLDAHQRAGHGVAWLATSVECLRQMQGWAGALAAHGRFGDCDALLRSEGVV